MSVRRQRVISKLRGMNEINQNTKWIYFRREWLDKTAHRPSYSNIEDGVCSICLEGFSCESEDVILGFIKRCGHFHHFDCVWKWIEDEGKCPLCREGVAITQRDMILVTLSELREILKIPTADTTNETDCISTAKKEYMHRSSESENNGGVPSVFTITMSRPSEDGALFTRQMALSNSGCSLCVRRLQMSDEIPLCYVSTCQHTFHRHCLLEWVKLYHVCPDCTINESMLTKDNFNDIVKDFVMESN